MIKSGPDTTPRPNMQYIILDHLVLLAIVVSVSLLLLTVPISPLLGSVLYFSLPSTYLIFRNPRVFKQALLPSLIFGFLFAISFEYLNEVGNSWIFPLETSFIFPAFFFGVVPLDVIIWYVLWVFLIVCYYEYLIDRADEITYVRRRIYKLLGVAFSVIGVITFAEYILNTSIFIPYAYTVTGLASLIPLYLLYKRKPQVMGRLIRTVPFLALFFAIMEAVALSVGYWEFAGGSVFAFVIKGHLIPIEEILLWIIASPVVISAYHELILEDVKNTDGLANTS